MRFTGETSIDLLPRPCLDDGIFDPGVDVQFYGHFAGRGSIANVCRQWSRELIRQFPSAGLHNYSSGPVLGEDDLESHVRINRHAPIGIYYGFPTEMPRDLTETHEVTIGAFVCETDRIGDDWVRVCNQLDLVVVPSTFCRRVFRGSGVTSPIIVVPHGIDDEYVPYPSRRSSDRVVFFNTFAASSFPVRKGAEELVRCFIRAFAGRSDVLLRLRTQKTGLVARLRDIYPFRDIVQIEHPVELGSTEFARIYSDVHCTVHPSKSEGFGLIPFQSIACATPVIAPPVTGMADYLDEDNAVLLHTGGLEQGFGWANQEGFFHRVDEDHLIHCLRHVYENWDREQQKVAAVARQFRDRYQWPVVLAPLIDVLKRLRGGASLTAIFDPDATSGEGFQVSSRGAVPAQADESGCHTREVASFDTIVIASSKRARTCFQFGGRRHVLMQQDVAARGYTTIDIKDGSSLGAVDAGRLFDFINALRIAQARHWPAVMVHRRHAPGEHDRVFNGEGAIHLPGTWDVIGFGKSRVRKDRLPLLQCAISDFESSTTLLVNGRFIPRLLAYLESMEMTVDDALSTICDRGIGLWYRAFESPSQN